MKVTLLGCGGSTGVPSLGGADGSGDWGACDPTEPRNRRSRSAIVLHGPAGNVLVDTGPDLRAQILANRIPRIDAIIYTHAHADHLMGLDDVRLLNRVAGKPIPAFGTQATMTEIGRRFDYAFRPWEPPNFFWPVLEMNTVVAGAVIETCGLRIQTMDQDHHVMRSLGLRVGDFAYSTDWVRLPAATQHALRGVTTWLCGCFQRAPHMTHAHVDLVVEMAEALGIARSVLTHMGIDLDWAWLRARLPAGMEPGFDGMVLEV